MFKHLQIGAAAALSLFLVAGCGSSPSGGGDSLSGELEIDGSGTVYPIAEALVEEFAAMNPDAMVSVAKAGTSAGMKRFADGEVDIANASRAIKESEIETLTSGGMDFVEAPIAFDGLSIVVHPDNDWIDNITVEQLQMIWKDGSSVSKWSDIDPSFPDEDVNLYGPNSNHGTYEYFSEVVDKENKATRQDYSAQQEYPALISGIAGDRNALGYIGYAYVEENKDSIKVLGVDGGNGPVLPSPETISDGTYTPLARPLFMYVKASSLDDPLTMGFMEFVLTKGDYAIEATGYTPLKSIAGTVWEKVKAKQTGSVFKDAEPGMSLEDVLAKEPA